MLVLSKEAPKKDVNLKTQTMISMTDSKGESSTGQMWKENGFFTDQKTDLIFVNGIFLRIHLCMLIMEQSRLLKEDKQCISKSLFSQESCL